MPIDLDDFNPDAPDAFASREARAWIMRERRRIKNGERIWELGDRVDTDWGNGTYLLEYPSRDNHPGIEMPIPVPVSNEATAAFWELTHFPLVDPMEALIGPFRWGIVARSIAALLVTRGNTGSIVVEGYNLPDGIEQALARSEDREPIHPSTAKPNRVANRHKTIMTALGQLLDYGYIYAFADRDNANRVLLQASGLMANEMPDLLRKYRKDFLPDMAEGLEGFPFVGKANPNPQMVVNYSEADYANLDVHRWEVDVTTKGARRQPAHVIARGVPVGEEFQLLASSVHQVSQIISTCALSAYIVEGPKVGLAITELAAHVEAKSLADVTQGILLLEPRDQMDVYDFVCEFLTEEQTEGLRLSQFTGTSPVDLIHEAVEMVPTKNGEQGHVLRQIRLLVAQLCQSLIGMWSGQVLEARPNREREERA